MSTTAPLPMSPDLISLPDAARACGISESAAIHRAERRYLLVHTETGKRCIHRTDLPNLQQARVLICTPPPNNFDLREPEALLTLAEVASRTGLQWDKIRHRARARKLLCKDSQGRYALRTGDIPSLFVTAPKHTLTDEQRQAREERQRDEQACEDARTCSGEDLIALCSAVGYVTGVSRADILGRGREDVTVEARRTVAHILHTEYRCSIAHISRLLVRDHSTVVNLLRPGRKEAIQESIDLSLGVLAHRGVLKSRVDREEDPATVGRLLARLPVHVRAYVSGLLLGTIPPRRRDGLLAIRGLHALAVNAPLRTRVEGALVIGGLGQFASLIELHARQAGYTLARGA